MDQFYVSESIQKPLPAKSSSFATVCFRTLMDTSPSLIGSLGTGAGLAKQSVSPSFHPSQVVQELERLQNLSLQLLSFHPSQVVQEHMACRRWSIIGTVSIPHRQSRNVQMCGLAGGASTSFHPSQVVQEPIAVLSWHSAPIQVSIPHRQSRNGYKGRRDWKVHTIVSIPHRQSKNKSHGGSRKKSVRCFHPSQVV